MCFGLPCETREDMLETVRYLAGLHPGPDRNQKMQMLNILKGSTLGKQYEEHPFPLLSLEEYTDLIAESIRILPENMVIHRMTGDGPGNLLIAPDWVRTKKKVLNTIHRKPRNAEGGYSYDEYSHLPDLREDGFSSGKCTVLAGLL